MNKNSALPLNDEEFIKWSNEIIRRSGVPDAPDLRPALAKILMQLPPDVSNRPLDYFVKAVKKNQINEVAYRVIVVERARLKKLEEEANAKASTTEAGESSKSSD